MTDNPYLSPSARLSAAPGVRVEGACLVVPGNIELPMRCVCCNAEPAYRGEKKLYWATPWILPLVLLWIVLYLLAYLMVRRRVDVSFSLCRQHRRAVIRRMAILWTVLLAGVALLVVGSAEVSVQWLAGIGLALLLGVVLAAIFWRGPGYLRVRRFRKGEYWIAGLKPVFLASFMDEQAGRLSGMASVGAAPPAGGVRP